MLTIICGEDTVKSRGYLLSLKESFIAKGVHVQVIPSSQIEEIYTWLGENQGLFFDKQVFFTEQLESRITRSKTKKPQKKLQLNTLSEIVLELANNPHIEIFDWEEGKQERELKLKNTAVIKEFKTATNIFKLQEACYPKNVVEFIKLLSNVLTTQDEQFVFIMLTRHSRSLLLAYDDYFSKSVQTWQKIKLKKQALLWSKKALISWYEGLFRIDNTVKSGTNPYGIKKSLEILACHYL